MTCLALLCEAPALDDLFEVVRSTLVEVFLVAFFERFLAAMSTLSR